MLSSISTDPVRPKSARINKVLCSRCVHHFTMTREQWRMLYNRKTCEVAIDWTYRLSQCLEQINITCCPVFKRHRVRLKNSRKRNCCLSRAKAYCKHETCPVEIEIIVEEEPKTKESPCLFTVVCFGD